jgi:hypothetical protein
MNSKVLKSSTFYSNLPISTFQDTSLLLHLQSLSLSLSLSIYIYIYLFIIKVILMSLC